MSWAKKTENERDVQKETRIQKMKELYIKRWKEIETKTGKREWWKYIKRQNEM